MGDRSVGRAAGTDLVIPPDPAPAGCDCGDRGVVARDPAIGLRTLAPSPR